MKQKEVVTTEKIPVKKTKSSRCIRYNKKKKLKKQTKLSHKKVDTSSIIFNPLKVYFFL